MTEPRLIRKYANRRLYDTVRSRYVNLDDMRHLIVEGIDIRVSDQATGSDITNAILLQILGSLDRNSGTLLSAEFLTDLIRAAARNHDPALPERLQIALRDVLPV